MDIPMDCPRIAGGSGASFRTVHNQRLLALALSILVLTSVAWEVMMSSWSTRAGPWRILGDTPSLLIAAACHGLAAFARYSISDVDVPSVSLPPPARIFSIVAIKAVIGWLLGIRTWNMASARADADLASKLAVQTGARGGIIAGGMACGVLSALHFFSENRHQLRLGLLPRGTPWHAFLSAEIARSLKMGLFAGVVIASVYLALRFVVGLLPFQPLRRLLVYVLGLPHPSHHEAVEAGEAGRFVVAYLVLLSTAINFALHSMLSTIMNLIILAPQDFVRLWHESSDIALSGGRSSLAWPSSPSAMLLDMLSIGHEAALWEAQKGFLEEKGGNGASGASSKYKPGSMYDWIEELELQRRALVVLASMDASTLTGSSVGLGAGARLPLWAQVAKAQALESFALRAPRDRELRVAVYDSNIVQVLRVLCLELDSTNLTVQSFRLREDPKAVARALGCEGRRDIQWLVQTMKSSSSAGSSLGGLVLKTIKEGFTPPYRETLFSALLSLWPSGGQGSGRDPRGGKEADKSILSSAKAQSAVWAAQGISALMVHAPGESRGFVLDAMLPAVLGSLAGLLLIVRSDLAVRSDPEDEALDHAGPEHTRDGYGRALRSHRMLSLELEAALTEVARKYRGCLGDYRFPPAYARLINSLCVA